MQKTQKNMHALYVDIPQFFDRNLSQSSICLAETFRDDSPAHGASFDIHPAIEIHQEVTKTFATKVAVCHDFSL